MSSTAGSSQVRLLDGSGNVLASASSAPAGTEQGLIVRNIPNGTQAVSGTITANQGGTWTVQPGNTANTTAWLFTKVFNNRSDTFTATGNGVTVDVSARPVQSFSIQVKGTGAVATAWDVRLEGGNNNSDFTQILQHTNVTGDGVMVFSGSSFSACLYFRSRCAGLTLGSATNIVVTILGIQ